MSRPWTLLPLAFLLFYLLALGLLAVGTFGLFGSERDPLSGLLLVPLGLPWKLFPGDVSGAWKAGLATAAPLLNPALLRLVCLTMRTRQDVASKHPQW